MRNTAIARRAVGSHRFPIRVYYEDTDSGGVVYYANYLKFAERARTEMLRDLRNGEVSDGVAFVVRHCTADFVKPARLDDLLDVETAVEEVGSASLVVDQRIRRGATDLVHLVVRLAAVDPAGRPARLPPPLKAALGPERGGIASHEGRK
ncbi:MAG: tol-pal system-associated acyl-CoA thioesterase [Rhodospirillales bacterium]|nr:tol-pal system-associated acyl-CoA thioesterase [Rhodospirillales bacterium]